MTVFNTQKKRVWKMIFPFQCWVKNPQHIHPAAPQVPLHWHVAGHNENPKIVTNLPTTPTPVEDGHPILNLGWPSKNVVFEWGKQLLVATYQLVQGFSYENLCLYVPAKKCQMSILGLFQHLFMVQSQVSQAMTADRSTCFFCSWCIPCD